jgi:hypothetical protein
VNKEWRERDSISAGSRGFRTSGHHMHHTSRTHTFSLPSLPRAYHLCNTCLRCIADRIFTVMNPS